MVCGGGMCCESDSINVGDGFVSWSCMGGSGNAIMYGAWWDAWICSIVMSAVMVGRWE